MSIWGIQLQRPSSGRATVLVALYAVALVALLYWAQFWAFEVNLAIKVQLSVSILWAYITTLIGLRVSEGWRAWMLYLVGLALFNFVAWIVLEKLNLR